MNARCLLLRGANQSAKHRRVWGKSSFSSFFSPRLLAFLLFPSGFFLLRFVMPGTVSRLPETSLIFCNSTRDSPPGAQQAQAPYLSSPLSTATTGKKESEKPATATTSEPKPPPPPLSLCVQPGCSLNLLTNKQTHTHTHTGTLACPVLTRKKKADLGLRNKEQTIKRKRENNSEL